MNAERMGWVKPKEYYWSRFSRFLVAGLSCGIFGFWFGIAAFARHVADEKLYSITASMAVIHFGILVFAAWRDAKDAWEKSIGRK